MLVLYICTCMVRIELLLLFFFFSCYIVHCCFKNLHQCNFYVTQFYCVEFNYNGTPYGGDLQCFYMGHKLSKVFIDAKNCHFWNIISWKKN